jgi:hypothetical protein
MIIGQLDLDLPAFGLGLLQAQNVWLVSLQKGQEQVLAVNGANAVHVPRV